MQENQAIQLSALRTLAQQRGWKVTSGKPVPHGLQVVVDDGVHKTILNFFDSGKIVIQGRESPLKEELSRWVEFIRIKRDSLPDRPNEPAASSGRVTKYHVRYDQIDKIRSLIFSFPGLQAKNTTGAAELYRVEVYQGQEKVTITQYQSGTLLIQGASNQLFDYICDALDQHLNQPFVDRAIRYLTHEDQRLAAAQYLEDPEAENMALEWLNDNLENGLLNFLHPKDRQTLISAAGIRNYCKNRRMPDYSPMVMPFGKALEGLILKLVEFLNISKDENEETGVRDLLKKLSNEIGSKNRQAKDAITALAAAWESRNKAMHSNPAHALSTLSTFRLADQEVTTIIRAMNRAYIILAQSNSAPVGSNNNNNSGTNSLHNSKTSRIESNKDESMIYDDVDRNYLRQKLIKDGYNVPLQPEGRKNEWEIKQSGFYLFAPRNVPGRVIIKGPQASDFVEKYKDILKKNTKTSST